MSLFNRPAWATTGAALTEDNLFRHSNSYNEIVAEEQRKKAEAAAKLRAKQERKERRISEKQAIKEEKARNATPSPKRRRISLEDDDEQDGPNEDDLSPQVIRYLETGDDDEAMPGSMRRGREDSVRRQELEDSSRRRSPRFQKVVNRDSFLTESPLSKSGAAVVEIGSDTSSELQDRARKVKPQNSRPPDPIDDESDDEIAELARKAREKRKREDEAKTTPTKPIQSRPDFAPRENNHARDAPQTPPNPTIKLLITSRIEHTNPLMVHRKLNQRLQEIREVWCKKQGFTEAFTQTVFLVHRMRRLYDVTTCKSLGLDVNLDGKLIMKGAEDMDGVENVVLEAVTETIYREMKREREQEEKARKGLLVPEEEAEAGANETQEATQAANGDGIIRVILKGKGMEPYKLKVKPTTVISKIITACVGHFRPSPNQAVTLQIDGETLDEEQTVQDFDIADLDCIDVHIA